LLPDYYSILGVDKDALPEKIRKAYHEKAKLYHPDVYQGSDGDYKFKLLNEAYRTLINPQLRRQYDFRVRFGSLIEFKTRAQSEQERRRQAYEKYRNRKIELEKQETLRSRKTKRLMDRLMTFVIVGTIGAGIIYGFIDAIISDNYRGFIFFLTIIVILPLAYFTSFGFRKKQ
jgi:curved DNA-binding protein CbpA